MTRSRKPRGKAAIPARPLIDAVLKKYGAARQIREHRLVTGWGEIVGERVAARAWPDGFRDGVLYVRVSNSAWLHELSFLRESVRERANELCGGPRLVKEVRFHLGPRRGDADDGRRATLILTSLATRDASKATTDLRATGDRRTSDRRHRHKAP